MTAISAKQTTPFFDPWAYVRDAEALRNASRSADVPTTLKTLEAIEDQEELGAALWTVAGETLDPDENGLTGAIRDAQDGSPLAATLLASRYVVLGWEIRSHARAEHVTARQFEQFHALLRQAERVLFDVCCEFPEYVPAWETRITSARGLQLGASETRRRYDQLAAIAPHHSRAQKAFLQQILPKWSGSWEESSEFVSACTRDAPPASLSHLLIVDLTIERHWDGDKQAPAQQVDAVREAARQSVRHPEHVAGHGTAQAHADLAHFFSLAGLPAEAKPHYDWLGDRPAKGTTFYNGAPEATYRKLRARADKAAAKGGLS
ncbi:hypothetical protein [Myceligenerans pegani]|uniref:Uncharacterized protein n=1 Tax=Myceligenerans pegani TaxID=2776917 RepID=A0ABR9N6E3_9MICO|nr:hypothetical protein [Myceligenerans sp. TRM 65318]MBE1878724.1 hypothetical protein [Myceligenerans sp. TRM 65318]MBE3020995.1 hypothetical protein [Myceligenerans sp. TRM 65318]